MPDLNDAPDLDATVPVAGPTPSAGSTPRLTVNLPLPEDLAKLLPEGTYTVEGFLGQGGMGAVYRGTQVRLQRQVAIKIMCRDQGKDHGFEERFRREALALAQLNHPNIVNVIDYGEAGPDYLYIVMEFVDGSDLVGVIRSGQMTQETALKLLPQICDALQFAHDNGIVHRDIKPANILLTRDGRIKMADFGLAKRFDVNSTFHTQTGAGMGTPDYAAPEQFDPHGNVDHRADIYALGVMIYQMVTGQLPRGAWKPPSEKADVDAHWDKIVSHALQTDPSDRYASVSEIKTDISSITPVPGGPHLAPDGTRGEKTTGMTAVKGSTTALTQAGGRPASQTRTLVSEGDAQPTKSRRSRVPLLMAATLVALAVGGYFGWEKFRTPAKPALPDPIRLWDAADKIPKGAGKTWEDDALRLDDVSVAHVFPLVQRVAVKTSIRVNPDTEAVKLGLKQRSRDEGAYFLYVDFSNANLALLIAGQDKQRHLKLWKMPRQYRPGEWLPVELRAVDGEISVSLEGKLLGTVHDSTFSDFTAFTLESRSYAHFRDIEVVSLDPSWTNQPPAPSIAVTETVAETVQRPVPKPAAWVDATAQVRDDVVQAGAGAVQGDWLVLSKPYLTRMPDRKILRNAVVRMSFKGVAGMALRTSPTDFSYQCVLNSDRTLGLFSFDGLALTRVHFNKRVKPEPDFDLLAEHELVMAVEEDLVSVWLDGRLMLSQRDSHIAQGQITVIFQAAGSDASLHPHVKKVEYADLGGTPAVIASQSAVSRTWQAPAPTVAADREWTNLIPHIKPERDVIRGGWTVNEKGLTAQRAEWAICNLPVQDPGTDYDLRYQVTRGEGSHLAMFFLFRKGDTGGLAPVDYIDASKPEFSNGMRIAGLESVQNAITFRPGGVGGWKKEWLPRGKTCTVLLQVREKEVRLSVDDVEAFRWQADWSQIRQRPSADHPMFKDTSGSPFFGVGIFDCEAVFHSIEMRRIGEAKSPVSASTPTTATKDAPFENTLGMKFVPVPITGGPTDGKRVLFSVWETRVQDYQVFVKEMKPEWRPVQFRQGTDHPAMNVSWEDAQAFCLWLTKREQKNAQLGHQDRYRLPTDHEWSCAVGIGAREDARALPQAKDQLIVDAFPWGREWPPAGKENYAGEELLGLKMTEVYPFITPISGHKDGFTETSPVGSFQANAHGLYDLGGNAWEWCEDWFDNTHEARVLRGAAWAHFDRLNLLSSKRSRGRIGQTLPPFIGFRCVLESHPE